MGIKMESYKRVKNLGGFRVLMPHLMTLETKVPLPVTAAPSLAGETEAPNPSGEKGTKQGLCRGAPWYSLPSSLCAFLS